MVDCLTNISKVDNVSVPGFNLLGRKAKYRSIHKNVFLPRELRVKAAAKL